MADSIHYPDSRRVLHVGWVGTGPFSFYGHYIAVINGITNDYNPLNMRITHIWGDDYRKNYTGRSEWVDEMVAFWESDDQSPDGLAAKFNIPNVADDFRDMADEVDAAMIMDFDRAYELAEPFLTRGKPVFLCSPVAVSVPECERILDLADEHGAAVHTGSFTAAMPQNVNRNIRVKREDIASYFASTSHHFFSSYANDGLEPLYWLIGPGVRTVTLHGWHGSSGYDPDMIPVSRIHLEYEQRDGNPPIQGTLNLGGYKQEMEWYRVYYRGHTVFEGTTTSSNRDLNFRDWLIQIEQVFATNTPVESRDDIINKLKVIIAAYKSANEGNRPVDIDEVGGYELPTVRIEHWDEIPN